MPTECAGETQFGNLTRQMSRIIEQMQRGYFNYCPAETWAPLVNLYESDGSYVVCVDLAGVDKDKIDLVVSDGRLKLRGQRAVPTPPGPEGADSQEKLRVHLMEIDHGPFCREVDLPNDVAVERIHATYINGMLWVELPKK